MVYNILKNLNKFIKNNELIVEANENSPRNQLVKHFSTGVSKEADKQNISQKVDLFFSLKKDGKLAGVKEKEKLDINWWVKNKKTFLDFDTFFDEFFNNPDNVSLGEYYLKYLKGKRIHDYNLVPKKIIQHLKNGENFDGNPATCKVYPVQSLVKKGFSVAFEDENWQVVVPHNRWASIFFSKMNEEFSWRYASWCTGKYDKEDNYNYFDKSNYTPYGFQYIVIDKKRRTKYNIQFSNHSTGNKQTEQNNTIEGGGYNIFPIEVIAAMFDFEDKFELNTLKQKNIKDFYDTLIDKRYDKKEQLVRIASVKKISAYDNLTTFFKILPIAGYTPKDLAKAKTQALQWYNENKQQIDEDLIKSFIVDNIGGKLISSTLMDRIFIIQIAVLGLQEFFINTLLSYMQKQERGSYLTFSELISDYAIDVLKKPELFAAAKTISIESGSPLPHSSKVDAFESLTPEEKDKYFLKKFEKNAIVSGPDGEIYPDSSILSLIKYIISAPEGYNIEHLSDNDAATKKLVGRIICTSDRYKEVYNKNINAGHMTIETDDEMNQITSNLNETEQLIQAFFKRALTSTYSNSIGVYNHTSFRILNMENRLLFIENCQENGVSAYSAEIFKIMPKSFINTLLVNAVTKKEALHSKIVKNSDFNKQLSDYIDMILIYHKDWNLESAVPIEACSQEQLVKYIEQHITRGGEVTTKVYNILSTESRQKYLQILINNFKNGIIIDILNNEPELFNETVAKYYFEKLDIYPALFHENIIRHTPKNILIEYLRNRIGSNTISAVELLLIPDELLVYYTEETMARAQQVGKPELFDRLNNINSDEAKKYVIYKINKAFPLSPNEKTLCDDELLYTYYKNRIDNKKDLPIAEFKKLISDKLRPLKHRYLKSIFPLIGQDYFADTSNAVKEDILKRFVDGNLDIPRTLLTVTPIEIQQKFVNTSSISMQVLTNEAFNGLDIDAKKIYVKNCMEKHILITPHQLSKLSANLQRSYLTANTGRFALSNDHFNVLNAENRLFYISAWLEAGKLQLLTPGQMDWARKNTK